MGWTRSARLVLSICLLTLPVIARADFRAPNPEELKMTSDPKAPGASAVYLYREDTTMDNKHYWVVHARIKVLTEKGRELATVRVPYEHGQFFIKNIEARTVHSDGTIIPMTVKPSDLVDFKTKGYQLNAIIFTLPSVEVGSVLEYRVEMSYDSEVWMPPDWNVQAGYFTHAAHFEFHPGGAETGAQFVSNLPDPSKIVKDKQGFTLDMTDVPSVPDEDWMPPLNTINWKVQFYYSDQATDQQFWRSGSDTWEQSVIEFIRPTPRLTKAATDLVTPADSPVQKAAKLYDAVMKLENTDFTRKRTKEERKKEKRVTVNSAEDVWKGQSGDSDQIALLYVALARAAGLTVYPMQVVNRNRAIFDPHRHALSQLDDYLAIVELDGKEVYLDPGEKMCPFGMLDWKHTLATGLREIPNGARKVGSTPAQGFRETTVQRVADLTVSGDGTVDGQFRIVMSGQEALYWRQVALQNDVDEVKRQFTHALSDILPEGVHADFDHFLGLDEFNALLVARVKVSGTLGTVTGKRVILPGLFFDSSAKEPFVSQETRITPIDVHYAMKTDDDVVYRLPVGLVLESAPQKKDVVWPQHAMLKIDTKSEGNTLDVTRSMAYNYVLLAPQAYSELHDFYRKIAAGDQQQVVLKRSAESAGQ